MNIDSSYVNAYNVSDISQTSLDKIENTLGVNKTSDSSSDLTVDTNFDITKNSVSHAVINMNNGIAMSSIAQSGLSQQEEILEEIRTQTLDSINNPLDAQEKDVIAQEIGGAVQRYENIANTTTFKGVSLLKTQGNTSDDISVTDETNIIPMEKADTLSISDTIKSLLTDFSTNEDTQTSMLNTVNEGLTQLGNFKDDYQNATNAMISSARNSISTEQEIASSNSTVSKIDYSKEVASFSKTNLLSQIGHIMQTQANAVQGRNINLLS